MIFLSDRTLLQHAGKFLLSLSSRSTDTKGKGAETIHWPAGLSKMAATKPRVVIDP